MNAILLMLIAPVVGAAIIYALPVSMRRLGLFHISISAVISGSVLCVVGQFLSGQIAISGDGLIFIDSLGAAFLVLIALTGFCANWYAASYFSWQVDSGAMSQKMVKTEFALSHLASAAMALSCVSNNMAIMWAALEATTIITLFMVAIKRDQNSVESGYKYVVICSVGLAFGLMATILLYAANLVAVGDESSAISWAAISQVATGIDANVAKIIFVLALIGFGTKAGLVPTHTWLPDAHATGPAPVSAIMSGIVIKCAMFGLMRFYGATAMAAGWGFVEGAMLISGALTLAVAAFFLIRQHDVKRMFAYHSVAHMGVIAFALGVGGKIGIAAAIFHCAAHSFTKALAFLTTGNTGRIYGTNNMHKMGAMIKTAPITTLFFGIAICSLVGVPAFAIFIGEFMVFKQAILTSQWLAVAIFAITLAIIFIADFSHFFMASFGEVEGEIKYNGEMSLWANAPLWILAFLVISFGLWGYEWWWQLVDGSVEILRSAK